jgi:hypothetical protein
MKRGAFITLLGGAAAWPIAARAQQGERMRRIGVLMSVAADGPKGQARLAAFRHGLQQFDIDQYSRAKPARKIIRARPLKEDAVS